METFLTVILFIFVGFWLFGRLGRWFLRYYIGKKQRQFQQQFGGTDGSGAGDGSRRANPFGGFSNFGGGGARSSSRSARREGEVVVTQAEIQSDYTVNKKSGEYVDYEEIETKKTEGGE